MQIYGIIIILILIALFIIYYFYYEDNSKQIKLHSDNIDFEKIKKLKNSTYFSTDKLTIEYNQAIVLEGEIPKNYIYWGINAYDCYTNNPISLPISSSNYFSKYPGEKIIIILTPNFYLYEEIRISLKNEKIVPILIPTDIYKITKEYNLVLHVISNSEFDKMPIFKAKIYFSPNINQNLKKVENVEIYNFETKNEKDILSYDNWELYCFELIPSYNNVFLNPEHIPLFPSYEITELSTDNFICLENSTFYIFAIDHCASKMSLYSWIEIYVNDVLQETYVTGNYKYSQPRSETVIVNNLKFNITSNSKVKITEKILYNTFTNIKPPIECLLPMKIFIKSL